MLNGLGVEIRRRWRRILSGRDRGSSTVEAVITIPVIVVFTLVVIQFALVWNARHTAQAAAQLGARSAATYQSSAGIGQADTEDYLARTAPNLLAGRSVQVDRGTDTVTVSVHASVPSVVPFASFTVDEQASVPVEAFRVVSREFSNAEGSSAANPSADGG